MMTNKTKRIAVDYDGTITTSPIHPPEPPIREEAIKYLTLLHEQGYHLYLWTARNSVTIEYAIDSLKKAGIYQYFEPPESKGFLGKIRADFYIDDKAIPGPLVWDDIYKFIIENVK